MKRIKKTLAMLLAMVMVLGMSATALAAPGTAEITVKGIEGEDGTSAELTYLQIIKPDQTTATGWAFTNAAVEKAYLEGYGKSDAQAVIQELIDARGKDGYANSEAIGKALSHVAALKDGEGEDAKSLFQPMQNPQEVSSAGVYAIKAAQEGYTYNNMAAYVGFGEAADGRYPALQNAELTAKRTKTGLDKSHNDDDKVSAIGQEVTYTIKTYVPYMDPLAENKTYFIYDEITGAEYVLEGDNVKAEVTAGGKALDVPVVPTAPGAMAGPATPSQPDAAADGAFYIDLSSLINDENSNAGQEILVTYTATVTAVTVDNQANAGHKTNDKYGSEYGEDKEDVYTGQITLTKKGEENDELLADAGFEVTDADGAVVYFTKDRDGVYSHVETKDVPADVKTALDQAAENKEVDRAELEIPGAGEKTYVRQVFTTTGGTVLVQGLNVGTYKFTEKTAPEGYSVNEEPAEAVLKVTKENGGVENDGKGLAASRVIAQTTDMADTRMNALPSTGGIGTTIFTIGGCAIMIAAAGLFFATRRKKTK